MDTAVFARKCRLKDLSVSIVWKWQSLSNGFLTSNLSNYFSVCKFFITLKLFLQQCVKIKQNCNVHILVLLAATWVNLSRINIILNNRKCFLRYQILIGSYKFITIRFPLNITEVYTKHLRKYKYPFQEC